MSELFKMHKKPWKANKRSDGYWYVEDMNGHAIASIVTSCKDKAEEIAMELLMPKEMAGLGLKASDALGYLDGMPERGARRRFDEPENPDITRNVSEYIKFLETTGKRLWWDIDQKLPKYGERVMVRAEDGKPYIARLISSNILDEDAWHCSAAPHRDGGFLQNIKEWREIPA